MRSLKLDGESRVRLVDVPDPVPAPGEVLVETVVSALCGSELKGYRGPGKERGNSGHEAAGVVAALGEGVSGLEVGRRVGITAVVGCGTCDQCRAGRFTWCDHWCGMGNMHAERFCAGLRACLPLDDDIPWAAGVLLAGDGFGVPYHSSRKIAGQDVRTVAVLGAGPIGLGSVLLQSWLGRRVAAVDVAPFRLAKARELGAAESLDAGEGEVVERLRAFGGGRGVDVALEAAGRPETALQCFQAVRTGGTVLFNGEQGPIELSPSEHFIRRDVTAVGSWYYHVGEYAAMVALQREGLAVERLVSHEVPAAEAQEAFAEFAAARTAKVLLRWRD